MAEIPKTGPGKLRPVQVLTVDSPVPVVVRFLGAYQGAMVHWQGGRSRYCPGERECPNYLHKTPILWKGWCPVEEWDEPSRLWWPAVLEITEALEEMLHGRQLRGELWALSRPKKKECGNAVEGQYLDVISESRLRKAFEVKPVLCRLFHVPDMLLGLPNPVPPKQILEPSTDGPPPMWDEAAPVESKPVTPEQMKEFRRMMKEQKLTSNGKPPPETRKDVPSPGKGDS